MSGLWVALAVSAIVVSCLVVVFFKGLSMGVKSRDALWRSLEETLADSYNFRFYGDCGAPRSLVKKFSPFYFSTCSMMGVIKDKLLCDVYDFSLHKTTGGMESSPERVYGLVLQVHKTSLKPEYAQEQGEITLESADGDYVIVHCPNQLYAYVLVVEEEYHPLAIETVEWYQPEQLKELMIKNLDIIHKNIDRFCALPAQEAA